MRRIFAAFLVLVSMTSLARAGTYIGMAKPYFYSTALYAMAKEIWVCFNGGRTVLIPNPENPA